MDGTVCMAVRDGGCNLDKPFEGLLLTQWRAEAELVKQLAAVAEDTDDKGSLPFDQLLKDAVDVRVWRWWRPA